MSTDAAFDPSVVDALRAVRSTVQSFLVSCKNDTDDIKANQLLTYVTNVLVKKYGEDNKDACLARVRQSLISSRDPEENNKTALHLAAGYSNASLVHMLLNMGADANALDDEHITPLLCATKHAPIANTSHSHMTTTRLLIEAGADVTARDKNKCTALYHASLAGATYVVDELIATGKCDVDAANEDRATPLYAAVCNQRLGTVKALLDGGASANLPEKKTKSTPLLVAVRKGWHDIVDALLRHRGFLRVMRAKDMLNSGVYDYCSTTDSKMDALLTEGFKVAKTWNSALPLIRVGLAAHDTETIASARTEHVTAGRVPCANTRCSGRGKRKCTRCQTAKYCSRDCQKLCWPAHRLECPSMQKALAK